MTTNPIVFVSYHKKFDLLSEPSFHPIHAGRAIYETNSQEDRDWLETNCIGDETGDNISRFNKEFCEMTAIYWIWKNFNFKNYSHIGHMQYRRHFILDENFFLTSPSNKEKISYGCIHFPHVNETYLQKSALSIANVKKILNEYEAILPIPGDLSKVGVNNLWEDYLTKIPGSHIDDLKELVMLWKELGLNGESLDSYLEYPVKRMYQMFIVSVEEFRKYCEFLFPILFELSNRIDVSLYTKNGKRTLGYLAELIYGWYFNEFIKKHKTFQTGISFIDGK